MNYCYATFCNSFFLAGALALKISMDRNNAFYPLIALAYEMTEMDKQILKNYGVIVIEITEYINNPSKKKKRFRTTLNKLHVWKLTDYDKVCFLDSDAILLQNIDDVFEIEIKKKQILACPDNGIRKNDYRLNTGVFVIKPSLETFNDLIHNLEILDSYDGSDQGFLNSYFADSGNWIPLSPVYNTLRRIFVHFENEFDLSRIKVLHYVGSPKPWPYFFAKGDKGYEELFTIWRNCFIDGITEYWEELLGDYLVELNEIVYNGNFVEGNLLYKHGLKCLNQTNKITPIFETRRHKLAHIVRGKKNILEIGVNGGHSALLILRSAVDINYVGFDLCEHKYVRKAVAYLQNKYDDQVEFYEGNSELTIPLFHQCNPDKKFDVIHIDGSHKVASAEKDIMNCKKLAHKDTILIFDQINKAGNIGPVLTRLWYRLIGEGIIEEVKELNCCEMPWDNRVGKYTLES